MFLMGENDQAPRVGRRRPERTPAQRALGLLVRREHSMRELVRKLEARGTEREEARAVVESLAADGWQDDGRFAEMVVRTRMAHGYGPRAIRAELEHHGVGGEIVQAVLMGLDEQWPELAASLVVRKFGPVEQLDLAGQRRAADLLLRRGFDHDTVRMVLRGMDLTG